MTNIDEYNASEALVGYYPNRLTSRTARLWARELTVHNWADIGAVEFFEGGGSNPTVLTGYSKNKLWLRADAGVTSTVATVRYYAGGDDTDVANWPTMTKAGFAAHLGARSGAELDLIWSSDLSGDPGVGKVRGNHATLGSVSEIAISKTGRQGQSYASRLATIDDDDILRITTVGGDAEFLDVRVTGTPTENSDYYTFPCSVRAANTLTNGQIVGVVHFPTSSAIDSANAAVAAAAASASDADDAQTAAEAALHAFTALYLGAKSSDPSVDNDGNALQNGAIYWNTTTRTFRAYDLATATWYSQDPFPKNVYFVDNFSGASDTAIIQAAFDAVSTGDQLIFSPRTYEIDDVVELSTDGVHIHFDGATFHVADDGTYGVIENGASGPMGFLFQDADWLKITGSAKILGLGTLGTTPLAGMVFDRCNYADVSFTYECENVAAGRMIFWCDHSVFGDVIAKDIYGTQTFSQTGTQGSVDVICGCRHSIFGNITAQNNYKPVRYLSVLAKADTSTIDNENLRCGYITATAYSGSLESVLVAVRSGVNTYHDGVNGVGFAVGAYFVTYSTDTGWNCYGNYIGSVMGTFASTGSSNDAAVNQQSTIGSPSIGRNTIGHIDAVCQGDYGIYCGDGKLHIGHARIDGGVNGIVFLNSTLIADSMTFLNANQAAMLIYQGVNCQIGTVNIETGSVAAGQSGAIRFNNAAGTGGLGNIQIDAVFYDQNATGNDYVHVVFDDINGADHYCIGSIYGTGSTGQFRLLADVFSVHDSQMWSATKPTSTGHSLGLKVWHSAPFAGGGVAWILATSGGSPSWRSFGTIA